MKGFTGPLEDRLAIRELIETYNDAVHRRDADDWAACWTEDARWEIGGQTHLGRDAVRAHWLTAMAGFGHVAMNATGGALRVDGDGADGRCYMLEVLTTLDGAELTVSGRYDDAFRREADGWRFAERRYTVREMRTRLPAP